VILPSGHGQFVSHVVKQRADAIRNKRGVQSERHTGYVAGLTACNASGSPADPL